MLDFVMIEHRFTKNGVEVFPEFVIKSSHKELMIRGGDFYAIWDEERGMWSTDEGDAIRLIDKKIDEYAANNISTIGPNPIKLYLWKAGSGSIDKWHRYCQKQQRDTFHTLDENLIFSNTELKRTDYASKRLEYPLEPGSIEAWDKLVSTLYSPEERHKIEWAIGSIVTGASKKLQKFMVLYGAAGTGKSTILNIVQQLFDGYYSVFDAKALGSSSNAFALEAFKNNPLVAIQHDGDLSRIEDNTRINSLVSHEYMTINEKFKSTYTNRFKCFLFMGTNKPVKITDGKSGLIRRLIDVTPSGKKLSQSEYKKLMKQVSFELGAIACHCRDVFLDDPGYYDDYMPISMMGASNDFYNYIVECYSQFLNDDGVTLKSAYERYKQYCEDANVAYPLSRMHFKEELKNYFWEYNDRFVTDDGARVRSYYSGFRTDKFDNDMRKKPEGKIEKNKSESWIDLKDQRSIFDDACGDCFSQYASAKETPTKKWENVKSRLCDLDTSKLHYVKVPEDHIVIDFDLKDEKGEKSYDLNLAAASAWPATYAEVSKGGAGIHLHYIYSGDVSRLSRIYDNDIEVKVFTGNSSLRRKLSKCNDIPIATINSGLPLKGEKVISKDVVQTEKGLRTTIKKCLNKEIHAGTKPNVDFIFKILEDAYSSDLKYDVSDMYNQVLAFAMSSTHQSDYCMDLVTKMHFKSDDISDCYDDENAPIVFYDIEVFPNLFLVNWKFQGAGKPVVRMINPSPSEIEELMRYRLVGFNNRRYDNHLIYARFMGYTNEQLYNLSMKIINAQKGDKNNGLFREAFNISYSDVYDFCVDKKSLKKWEIQLSNEANDPNSNMDDETREICKAIRHHELGLPWDQPVPEELWEQVAEYCDDDVLATEAVFNARQADFIARQIQVALVEQMHGIKASVNDTTNTLSIKIVFGNNKKPQSVFNWRDLSKPVGPDQYEEYRKRFGPDYRFRIFDNNGLPIYKDYIPGGKLPDGYSILPFFPDYKFEYGKSTYMDEDMGEGGRVYAEQGMYGDVWDGDVSSMHPHSAIFECIFGPEYTKIFEDIVKARVAIKHRDFELAGTLLGGALKPFLNEDQADGLAQALKIVINSIYGLTSANFENPFRDPNNIDNIVAKRGALFMTLLKSEVEKRGYTVAHIKTDSIKIPDADEFIEDFVIKFGKEYGYSFETEARFEKFCIVNDAVYIAKDTDGKWHATGAQFAVPYLFKTLFSHEDILFEDMCETFAVQKGALYLDMNETLTDVSGYEKELEKLEDKYKKGKISDITFEQEGQRLNSLIEEGHDLKFVGRVGQFCPVKDGFGGGVLYRVNEGKKYAAPGSKGYRWIESERLKASGNFDAIDHSFYKNLIDDAIDTISKYGDFEWFVSDDPYVKDFMKIAKNSPEEVPFA